MSLNDDTDSTVEKPLFSSKLSNIQFSQKSYDKKDDAGTFILKKLGIWQIKNASQIRDQMFKDMNAVLDLRMDYYNHRSQAYEPLLEPWFL